MDSIGLHVVLVIFCLLILLLARENQRLEQRLHRASMAAAGGPEVQDLVPELPVTGLDGIESVLAFGELAQDSVVLVFTTTCGACQRNVERWRELYRRHGNRYRFIAVGLDPREATRLYAEHHELPFEVVVPANRSDFQRAYGITSVPQTLVIGPDGRVKTTQPGVLARRFDLG